MSSRRDAEARAQLTPLADGERPRALLVAIAVSALLAVGVLAGVLTSSNLSLHGGSVPGGIFLSAVLAALSVSMVRRRYWAVLGFEALLAFQVVIASLALVVADTLLAAGLCVAAIAIGGTLFFKLVKVLGRIQVTERLQDARAQDEQREEAADGGPVEIESGDGLDA